MPSYLPGGDPLADVRMRRDVLIGVVSDAWARLAEDKKRENLQSLLRYGKESGVATVMLLDGRGLPVGSASEQHISIESDLHMPQ